mgnify:CR=1 FL=1
MLTHFKDFWVFVFGPVIGALLAVAYYTSVNTVPDQETGVHDAVDPADVELAAKQISQHFVAEDGPCDA